MASLLVKICNVLFYYCFMASGIPIGWKKSNANLVLDRSLSHPYWLNMSRALLGFARRLWHLYWLNISRALPGLTRGLSRPYWLNMSRLGSWSLVPLLAEYVTCFARIGSWPLAFRAVASRPLKQILLVGKNGFSATTYSSNDLGNLVKFPIPQVFILTK
jgi:hypothetical protein